MAVKLSYTASETLNDIILHRLQNDGLQKAEALEKAFYEAFERIEISPKAEDSKHNTLPADVMLATMNDEFAIAYSTQTEDIIVLDICHVSRYANLLNT